MFPTFSRLNAYKDYPVIDVPVYFFLGPHDRVVSPRPAVAYLDALEAPAKEIVRFEQLTHNPHWEEPARFMEELRRVPPR